LKFLHMILQREELPGEVNKLKVFDSIKEKIKKVLTYLKKNGIINRLALWVKIFGLTNLYRRWRKMKVQPSVKPICEKCKIIKRKGKVMVICENPRHKQKQG